MLRVRVF